MFKQFASDALGLSDIGKIIPITEYHKTDSDDYVFYEDNEKIFFLIKSRKDEYCFTNRALIHLDGSSAISKKKALVRYEYYKYPISKVFLETAGTIDLDIEIKFNMGEKIFSIDVDKQQIELLRDLYKALYSISEAIMSARKELDISEQTIKMAAEVVTVGIAENVNKADELMKINNYIHSWTTQARKQYIQKDFSDIFLKYINN